MRTGRRSLLVWALLAWCATGNRVLAQDAGMDAGVSLGGVGDAGTLIGPDAALDLTDRPEPPMLAVAQNPAQVVAHGRGVSLTAGELAAIINARPPAWRGAYADPAALDGLAQEIVHDRLLAVEARERRILENPDVRHRVEAVMARALEERELGRAGEGIVTAAVTDQYYANHQTDFTRPERVRISVIACDDVAVAERVLVQARTAPPRRFRALVRTYSQDTRSRHRDGSYGWVDRVGGGADPALVEAAFAIDRIGGIAPTVVHTLDDLHWIVRLDERRAPEEIPIDDVRATIESRIRSERRQAAEARFAARVAHQHELVIESAVPFVRVVGPAGGDVSTVDAGLP